MVRISAITQVDFSFGGQNDAFKIHIENFATKMKAANFNLLVVFNGLEAEESEEALALGMEKSNMRVDGVREILAGFDKAPFKCVRNMRAPFLHPLARGVLLELLREHGIVCRYADGDSRDMMLAFAAKHKCAVMTHDSDFIFRDIPSVIRMNTLQFGERDNSIRAQVVRPKLIAESYGITIEQLPLLATLCGAPDIPFYHLYVAHHHILEQSNANVARGPATDDEKEEEGTSVSPNAVAMAIAELIKTGKSAEELIEMVADMQLLERPDLEKEAEPEPEPVKEEKTTATGTQRTRRGPKQRVEDMPVEPTPEPEAPKEEEVEEELTELEIERRRVMALPDAERRALTITALKDTLAKTTRDVTAMEGLRTISTRPMPFYESLAWAGKMDKKGKRDHKVPASLQKAYFVGAVDPVIMSILMHGTYWAAPHLENVDAEPSVDAARPIRQIMYAALLGGGSPAPEVTEVVRGKEGYTQLKVAPTTTIAGKTVPAIGDMDKLSDSQRFRVFLASVGGESAKFKALEPEDVLPTAALRHLVRIGHVTPAEALAVVQQYVHVQDHWEHIRASQVKRSRRAIHLGAVWQHTLLALAGLDQVLGRPNGEKYCLHACFDGAGLCWALDDITQGRGVYYARRSDIYSASELVTPEAEAIQDGFTVQGRESRKNIEETKLIQELERARKIYQAATSELGFGTIAAEKKRVVASTQKQATKAVGSSSRNRFAGLVEPEVEYSDDE